MNILLVEFTSVVCGAEKSLLELLRGLREDHRVTLACPEGPLAENARELGVRVLPIPGSQLTFRLDPRTTPRASADMVSAAGRLAAIVRTVRPDVVHANSVRAGLQAILAARGISPVVVHCRDVLPGGPLGAAVRAVLLRGADWIVAISGYVASSLAGPGWARRGVTVVDNCVDVDRFDPVTVSRAAARRALTVDDRFVLSVIAQITPRKGQDIAIMALAELRRRGVPAVLLIVGEAKFVGPSTREDNRGFERELRGLVEAFELGDQVRFLGERSDPERILAATDVLMVPSTVEPFGRTIIEAMAMRVPVAATGHGGPPEIMGGGIGGCTVKTRSPVGWADAVEELRAWPAEQRAASRPVAAARFSPERHAAAMLAVYGAVLTPGWS
jgi:glycosyltransferase involved in cell wall biosynthesis